MPRRARQHRNHELHEDGPFFAGVVTVLVIDNGPAGTTDAIDGALGVRSPSDCSPFSSAIMTGLVSGDIVVVDAPALPTSTDQCKSGGWRNYGTSFKNQGQCVAFCSKGRSRRRTRRPVRADGMEAGEGRRA